MSIATAFPRFPASDLPAIPANWKDTSWHNDMCPSFSPCEGLTVFIDRINPADRGDEYGPRFAVVLSDMPDPTGCLYDGDDWEEVLAEVNAYGIEVEAERSRA
jgi:hypothetical protein